MTLVSEKQSKELAEVLQAKVNEYREKYMVISQEITALKVKQLELERQMDGFIDGLARITGQPKERWQKALLNVEFSLWGKSIGDALETIILSEGAQKQKYLIDKMRAEGVKISRKAPYAVIKNAILRDKRKRFTMLDDGRVDVVTTKANARSEGNRKRANQQKRKTITKGTGV